MCWFISKCLLDKYTLNQCWLTRGPPMWQSLSQDLGRHCPFRAHSPTHRITPLLLLRSRHKFLPFSVPDGSTWHGKWTGSLFFHLPLLQIPQKLLLFPTSIWLNLSKEDAPRISICKLWWRSRSQPRSIGFFGSHKHGVGPPVHSPQHSALTGGQIPLVRGTIKLYRHTQTHGRISDTKISPTSDSDDEIKTRRKLLQIHTMVRSQNPSKIKCWLWTCAFRKSKLRLSSAG